MGFIAVMLTYLARVALDGFNQILLLVLCGAHRRYSFSGLVSVIKYTTDPMSKLPEITYWLMGSIAKVTWNDPYNL